MAPPVVEGHGTCRQLSAAGSGAASRDPKCSQRPASPLSPGPSTGSVQELWHLPSLLSPVSPQREETCWSFYSHISMQSWR